MLRQYLLTISVLFDTSGIGEDETGRQELLGGFFQNIGITASSISRTKALADEVVKEGREGRIDWTNSIETEIDLETFDIEISRQCKESGLEGVWYVGPKFLYEADQGQA